MTQHSLERQIADWMADEASGPTPDQLFETIDWATRRTRPLPRWLAVLKEPAMTTLDRTVVGVPKRSLFLLAALLLLIAALAIGALAILIKAEPAELEMWSGYRGDAARGGVAVTGPIGNPVVRWQVHVPASVRSAIAVSGDLAIFGSDDGFVHAVAAETGVERWAVAVAGVREGPFVDADHVYAPDEDGIVHALALADGHESSGRRRRGSQERRTSPPWERDYSPEPATGCSSRSTQVPDTSCGACRCPTQPRPYMPRLPATRRSSPRPMTAASSRSIPHRAARAGVSTRARTAWATRSSRKARRSWVARPIRRPPNSSPIRSPMAVSCGASIGMSMRPRSPTASATRGAPWRNLAAIDVATGTEGWVDSVPGHGPRADRRRGHRLRERLTGSSGLSRSTGLMAGCCGVMLPRRPERLLHRGAGARLCRHARGVGLRHRGRRSELTAASWPSVAPTVEPSIAASPSAAVPP